MITNYHAFMRRERVELSKGGRQLLKGRLGDELNTQETEGQMLQRVMPDLMGMKNILTLNDEAQEFRWVTLAEAMTMELNQPTRLLLEEVLKAA